MSSFKSTRRSFLRTVGSVTGAAAAVPYVWSSSHAKAADKNSRAHVGMIGCGRKGRHSDQTVKRFGDVVACCDVDRSRAEQLARGKSAVYGDYRKLLDRKDLDVIIVSTPDHWHTGPNIAALRAGLNVYAEKPLTLTIDEGKQICRVVKQTGQVLQVGTQQRSDDRFQLAVAMARSGMLGKKLTVTCYVGAGKKGGPFVEQEPPKELDWDFWLGQAPKVPYIPERCHINFRWWFEYSGGKLTDWGAHHIDIAQWAIGAENTGPIEIEGQGVLDRRPNCFNTAQTFTCTLRFANGNKIIVKDGPGYGVFLEGEKEHIFVSRGAIKGNLVASMTTDTKAKLEGLFAAAYAGRLGQLDPNYPMPSSRHNAVSSRHMDNFFKCIEDGKLPLSDVYTHHRVLSSCHLCNIAMRLGRKLRWDPVREDFIGDEQASAMRAREQREPYSLETLLS